MSSPPRCWWLGGALVALACGNPLPVVPSGPHRAASSNQASIVNYPPPPARVECVPEQPREECLWVDGNWRWAGRRWEWLRGAWVVPPAGCYHAGAYAAWLGAGPAGKDGSDRLYYFPAGWYPQRPEGSCARPRVCSEALPADEC